MFVHDEEEEEEWKRIFASKRRKSKEIKKVTREITATSGRDVGLESGHRIRFRWMDSKRGSRSENEKTKNNSDSNEIERSRLDYWMRER